MLRDDPMEDPFAKLTRNLGELEVVLGDKARPVVARIRGELTEAAALRERGDVPGALKAIRRAMESLAALAANLDDDEGAMMRAVAERFAEALSLGDKGAARRSVKIMREKAGDTPKAEPDDW